MCHGTTEKEQKKVDHSHYDARHRHLYGIDAEKRPPRRSHDALVALAVVLLFRLSCKKTERDFIIKFIRKSSTK